MGYRGLPLLLHHPWAALDQGCGKGRLISQLSPNENSDDSCANVRINFPFTLGRSRDEMDRLPQLTLKESKHSESWSQPALVIGETILSVGCAAHLSIHRTIVLYVP